MKIRCVWEHNGSDTLLYADNFVGAFTRGETKEIAMGKMRREVESYRKWCGVNVPDRKQMNTLGQSVQIMV